MAQTYTVTKDSIAYEQLKKQPVTEKNFRNICDLMQHIAKTDINFSYKIFTTYLPKVKATEDHHRVHILLMGWARPKESLNYFADAENLYRQARENAIENPVYYRKSLVGTILLYLEWNKKDSELVRDIKALGAKGFLLKTTPSHQIKEAIAAVAAGNTWFTIDELPSPSVSPYLVDDFIKKYQLTKREVEIIRMIGSGFTTKGIGEKLFVSEFTINAHRRNISRKLNIHTPVGLLHFAKEKGLA